MTDPAPPTGQQLDELEALANAATEGPWCTDGWEIYQGAEYRVGAAWIGETCRGPVDSWEQDNANAAFAAAARAAVPALAAEVRRLRARQLTPGEYNAAWHAVEGAAGEEGADPGTVLHAVLDRLGIEWQDAAHPAAPAAGVTGE